MSDLSNLGKNKPVDIEALRKRLRKMSDAELIRQGEAGRYMVSPESRYGGPPRECFVIQLQECIREWRRRHPARKEK